jgi:hypothetical protein
MHSIPVNTKKILSNTVIVTATNYLLLSPQ